MPAIGCPGSIPFGYIACGACIIVAAAICARGAWNGGACICACIAGGAICACIGMPAICACIVGCWGAYENGLSELAAFGHVVLSVSSQYIPSKSGFWLLRLNGELPSPVFFWADPCAPPQSFLLPPAIEPPPGVCVSVAPPDWLTSAICVSSGSSCRVFLFS
eukprot:7387935-Prymnesium_polylepis.1